MKINLYNLFVIAVLSFSSLMLFGDNFLSFRPANSDFEEPENKNEVILNLCENYDTEKIQLSYNDNFSNFLDKTVVLDSLLVKTYKKSGDCFIQVAVNNENSGYIVADLKCEESTFQMINKMQNPTLVIVASIKKLSHLRVPFFTENFDGEKNWFEMVDEFKLEGECLEAIEVSVFDS